MLRGKMPVSSLELLGPMECRLPSGYALILTSHKLPLTMTHRAEYKENKRNREPSIMTP